MYIEVEMSKGEQMHKDRYIIHTSSHDCRRYSLVCKGLDRNSAALLR